MDGTMQLLADLAVPIESVGMLVFSELVSCPSLGTVTRAGFVDGLTSARSVRPNPSFIIC